MFRDLRTAVSSTRRFVALGLLLLLLAAGAWALGTAHVHPWGVRAARVLFWMAGLYAGIRIFTWLLLDPLLSDARTAVPGFARDLTVFLLYIAAAVFLLHREAGIHLGALLGTGALAAAVVGLSLQETLGSLFAGISLSLDQAFKVGDWIEVTGNLRGGAGQETFVGQVDTMTWRSVQIVTENGDTTILPNRVLAQAIVNNLYAPSGLHRRTFKVVVEPHTPMTRTLEALELALAGIPHHPHHRPQVVTHGFDMGGVVLEVRWWALGFRHGRAGNYQAVRLTQTVLNRLGVALLGPHGSTSPRVQPLPSREEAIRDILRHMNLPAAWIQEMQEGLTLRRAVQGEGVVREGDAGESLFMVMSGALEAVKVEERTVPCTGLYWKVLGELGPGDWFGEGSLLTGAPRSATVVARETSELVELPKSAIEPLLKRNPEWAERLVDLMESRAARMSGPAADSGSREKWLAEIKQWFRL